MKSFFKDEFRFNGGYKIPFSHILKFQRNIFPLIRDSCDYVCPYVNKCNGHKLIEFIDKLYEFQSHAVLNEKYFFGYFYFYNFRIKKDKNNNVDVIEGWEINSLPTKDLTKYTFSQRCQYLG